MSLCSPPGLLAAGVACGLAGQGRFRAELRHIMAANRVELRREPQIARADDRYLAERGSPPRDHGQVRPEPHSSLLLSCAKLSLSLG